jgi:aminoglycoside phosphotransferase (APT) family kinase protein
MPEALSLERAAKLLTELLPERGPVHEVSRFADGSVTGAYRVEFADPRSAPVVLKIYATENRWWAIKEALALRFLTDHGIDLSPRLLAYSEAANALDGRPCVVCAFLPGRSFEPIGAELTPAQRHDVYRQLGEVLRRLHSIPADAYGYILGEIRDPLPDNAAHMARLIKRYLREFREHGADPDLAESIAGYVAEHSSAFAECLRPAYCHGDVHEANLLVEVAEDGTCALTGLVDPQNMHAGDPLMDLVRLDAFSMFGDETKIAGLLSGYGVREPGQRPGEWPESWLARIRLYRIVLCVELYNWFTIIGRADYASDQDRLLRELVRGGV